ncbi:hypothetical protein LTS10_005747 [Elasticomyces elasticus]|nr:hypothetical protein LTS10_005747 [Elasticomyces elasticus]
MTNLCSGQSAAAPQQDDHFRLLDLPPEMAVHIISFVGVHDLPTLRLVSHEVASLGFKHFAEEYLYGLSCYFKDPLRLQRLYNIISSPSLGDHVRRVTFTVNPDEGTYMEDVPTVPVEGETLETTQYALWGLRSESEALRLHGQSLDVITISAVLARIYDLTAFVVLDFTDSGGYPCGDKLSEASFWALALLLGCNISNLDFDDETHHHAQRLIDVSTESLSTSLVGLGLDAAFGDSKKHNSVGAVRSCRSLLGLAGDLQRLDIHFSGTAERWEDQDLQVLEPRLLQNLKSTKLQSLCLDGMRLHYEDVLLAVQRSYTTLTTLQLEDVQLITPTDTWTEILKYVQRSVKLHEVRFGPLWRVDSGGKQMVHFCTPQAPEGHTATVFECDTSRAAVGEGLAFILDNGLQYV